MHPKNLKIEDFTYSLPPENIALYPAHPRDSSRLLIYNEGQISEDRYRHLVQYLPPDPILVFNDTRVIHSRLLFHKSTGGVIEIFCLEPYETFRDYDSLFQQTGCVLWKCMIGKAGKWKDRQLQKDITIRGEKVTLIAELEEKLSDAYLIRFTWHPQAYTFGDILDVAGVTPLPPYIKRKAQKEDEVSYQTVYSEHEGSVAAPTAGLHFTQDMMSDFKQRHIPTLFTTLHVGAGTFKPVKSETMAGHAMHAEWMDLHTDFLKELADCAHQTIISVGTTATRTLESIYWMGNKILNNPDIRPKDLKITQWEVYDPIKTHPVKAAILALLQYIKRSGSERLLMETEIIIAPAYHFKLTRGLITNFHQPQSTLLLLVAALAGENWKRIYDYALTNDFRFLSYGDGCLILP